MALTHRIVGGIGKKKHEFWTLKTFASKDFDISRLTERQQIAFFAAQTANGDPLMASPFRIDRIIAQCEKINSGCKFGKKNSILVSKNITTDASYDRIQDLACCAEGCEDDNMAAPNDLANATIHQNQDSISFTENCGNSDLGALFDGTFDANIGKLQPDNAVELCRFSANEFLVPEIYNYVQCLAQIRKRKRLLIERCR